MAAVAGHTAVHIPADGRVAEIGCNVVPMANGALENRIGRCDTGMANRANAVCSVAAVIQGKERMRERRSKPIGSQGCVARRAVGWGDPDDGGVRGEVIRDRPAGSETHGALPGHGVATVAIDRRHSGTDVAKGASGCSVRADQGESRRGVVKDRARPGGCVVARLAGLWIGKSHVVRSWRNKDRGGGA